VPLGLEKFFSHVHVGLGEEERASHGVSLKIHVEQGVDEPLRFREVILVVLAGELALRSDGWNADKVVRNLPVEVQIGEDALSSPGNSLLGELVDKYLGKLLHTLIVHPDQIRS